MASVKKRAGYGYEVRYVDPATGRRPSKTFELKKDAEAYRRKVEREIEDGTHTAAADAATVADVARTYLANVEQRTKDGRLSRTRLDDVERVLRIHIIPRIGGRRMRDLVPSDVESTYRELTAAGLSPMSARHAMQELGTLERFAFRMGATKTTPIGVGLADLRGIKSKPIATMTQEEAALVLRQAIGKRPGIRRRAAALLACAVHLAGVCGLREGEVLALSWDCLDLDGGELRIRRSLSRYGVKGPKSAAGNRNVPMPPHLIAMLIAWRDTYFTPNPAGLVFTNIANKPVKGERLRDMWHHLLREAGLYRDGDPFHFHALRHFAASWWIENPMALPEVATMLGHSEVDMTLSVYAHSLVRPQARSEAMARMAARLTQVPLLNDASVTQSA